MNLHRKLLERAANGNPLRIGLIGAGKFGAMYLSQIPTTPGIHLVGIADLSPARRAAIGAVWHCCAPAVAAVALVRHLAARVRHYTDDRRALVSPKEYEAETARQETAWHRLAGTAEGWTAHWSFTAVNLVIWTAWLASNGRQLMKELPTITGLTMWLSVQAIVMTTLVLVAQKRADEKEKRRRDLEFQWASATMDRINQVNDRLGHLEQRTPTVAPATGAPES